MYRKENRKSQVSLVKMAENCQLYPFTVMFSDHTIQSMLSMLDNISANDVLKYFRSFDISCKLSAMETVCMLCQILFSGGKKKKKKNREKLHLLN